MFKTVRLLVFVFVALSLVLAACGAPATEAPVATEAPATEAPATEAPTVEPTADPMAMYAPDAVTGDIITAGSSTVFPVTERMAELFQQEGYTGNITVDSIGTGAGFERFCVAGETDISNASRAIKDSEVEQCRAIGREPLEFRIATDALAVVVSATNDFVTELTIEQIARIYNGEFTTWDQVDPSFPAETIQVYSPGSDSGTFDYFVEAVMDDFGGEEALLAREGAQYSEDDNVLVQGVEGSPYAIAYFGYAYYIEEADRLKAILVEGVEPTQENVDNGTYPLARPLFIYSTAEIMQEKPQVAAFIYFYLTNLEDNIIDIGYFPAPTADFQTALDNWAVGVGQ
jgi:phosphate binding protein